MRKLSIRLKKDPSSSTEYKAMAECLGCMCQNDVINEMLKDGSEYSPEVLYDIINLFNKKVAHLVLSGYHVNTGLVHMYTSVAGSFPGKKWNPRKNYLQVPMNPGYELHRALSETDIQFTGKVLEQMELHSVLDIATSHFNSYLSKGRNAELRGVNIKLAGDHPDCGLKFRNAETGEEIKLQPDEIVDNGISRILIYTPERLKNGQYQLIITSQYCDGDKLLKEPRTLVFQLPLIII